MSASDDAERFDIPRFSRNYTFWTALYD